MPTPKSWYGEAERLRRYYTDLDLNADPLCYDDNGDRLHDMLCNRSSDAACRNGSAIEVAIRRICKVIDDDEDDGSELYEAALELHSARGGWLE